MLIRRTLATMLLLMAFVLAVGAVGYRAMIVHSIDNSQRLDKQFKRVASGVRKSRTALGRELTVSEIDAVIRRVGGGPYEVMVFQPGFDMCSDDATGFSRLTGADYLLAAWRGEWWDCYSPTRNKSTITVDQTQYTMLGTIRLDLVMLLSVAVLCALTATKLWVRKHPE